MQMLVFLIRLQRGDVMIKRSIVTYLLKYVPLQIGSLIAGIPSNQLACQS